MGPSDALKAYFGRSAALTRLAYRTQVHRQSDGPVLSALVFCCTTELKYHVIQWEDGEVLMFVSHLEAVWAMCTTSGVRMRSRCACDVARVRDPHLQRGGALGGGGSYAGKRRPRSATCMQSSTTRATKDSLSSYTDNQPVNYMSL